MRDLLSRASLDGITERNKCDKIFEFFNGMHNIDLNRTACFSNASH